MPGFLFGGGGGGLRPTVVSAGASAVASRRFVTSLSGDRPGQAVVGREQRTAPADGQCVEDAQFAQRTPVVPGVGEEFRSPRGFRRAAFGADDEGFAQCCAGDVFVARIAGGGFV